MPSNVTAQVLVALDSAQPARDVLKNLPMILDADTLELIGIYVEDEDLARAALLPYTTEVTFSGAIARLDTDSLNRAVAAEAHQLRAAFEELARELRLRCSFQIARGRHADELSRYAAQVDFVLITRPLRASGLRPHRGEHFSLLVAQEKNLLLVNEPWNSGSNVVVLCPDGVPIKSDEPGSEEDNEAPGDTRTLATAARLAATEQLGLVIVVASDNAPQKLPGRAVVKTLDDWSESAVADLCLAADARLLVLPPGAPVSLIQLLPNLIDRLPCSILRLV